MQPPLPSSPTLRSDIELREIDGDVVLYDPVDEWVAVLNLSAAATLELCDGDRTLSEIVDGVASAFEVPREAVERDVEEVIERFFRLGLFRRDP